MSTIDHDEAYERRTADLAADALVDPALLEAAWAAVEQAASEITTETDPQADSATRISKFVETLRSDVGDVAGANFAICAALAAPAPAPQKK